MVLLIFEVLCKPIIFYFTPIFLTLVSYLFLAKNIYFAPKYSGQPVIGNGLTEGMHCIVPRVGKSRGFERGLDYKYALYYTQLESGVEGV